LNEIALDSSAMASFSLWLSINTAPTKHNMNLITVVATESQQPKIKKTTIAAPNHFTLHSFFSQPAEMTSREW